MTISSSMPQASLKSELQQLVQESSDWWTRCGEELDAANEVSQTLFHYTDMRGMLGIISTEQIWFTSIFHMNDPSELAYGIEIALGILRDQSKGGSPAVKAFCEWMVHVLVKAGGEIFGFFVASFSRSPDDLGQWRAYADNGRGVAIGLAPTVFQVVPGQSNLGLTDKTLVAHVIYDPPVKIGLKLIAAIRRAIGLIVRGDRSVTSSAEQEAFGRVMAVELAVPIFVYSVTCKHPAYAHENETRLLLINNLEQLSPIIETRVRGSNLVPYIPIPMGVRSPGVITKIMIGPAADDLADEAIRALLRRQGLPLNILERSKIPYTAR
jgi:Protein of unknown function (DUF2971)